MGVIFLTKCVKFFADFAEFSSFKCGKGTSSTAFKRIFHFRAFMICLVTLTMVLVSLKISAVLYSTT